MPIVAIPGKDSFANSYKRSIQKNKQVPLCSVVGYVRAAKLWLEWVTWQDAPTGHPYRGAKQRQHVAPGGSLGSFAFCTNPAANAAIRKHPSIMNEAELCNNKARWICGSSRSRPRAGRR